MIQCIEYSFKFYAGHKSRVYMYFTELIVSRCKPQTYKGEYLAIVEHCSLLFPLTYPLQAIMMLAVPTQDYINHTKAKSWSTLNILIQLPCSVIHQGVTQADTATWAEASLELRL